MDDTLVTVATFDTPVMAELARIRLEAEGIEAFLIDQEFVSMAWHFNQAVGGIKLLVRCEDAEQAFGIIGEVRAEQRPETGEKGIESDEELVDRAYRTAAFGLFLFPLQIYSILLLVKLLSRKRSESLAPRVRKRTTHTLLLNLWLVLWIVVLWMCFFGEQYFDG